MNETKMNDTAMDTVNKALTISNRQHEVFSHVHVVASTRRTLLVNLFTELAKWQLGVVQGGVLATSTHCWCTLLVQDEVQGGKLQRRLVAGVMAALRAVAKRKGDTDSPSRTRPVSSATRGSEGAFKPIDVIVKTVGRAVQGGQEFTVFKVATPQWAEATVIEEVLRTLVVHPLGGNLVIIAAQVDSTATAAGLAMCVQDEDTGGALTEGQSEGMALEITRRVRHLVASCCASPPPLPPSEQTHQWLDDLERVARQRLDVLHQNRAGGEFAVTLLDPSSSSSSSGGELCPPSPTPTLIPTLSSLSPSSGLLQRPNGATSPTAQAASGLSRENSSVSSAGSESSTKPRALSGSMVPIRLKPSDQPSAPAPGWLTRSLPETTQAKRTVSSTSAHSSQTSAGKLKSRLLDSATSMIRSASSSMLMTTRDTNKKPAPRRPGFKGGPPNHCWRYMPWAKNGDGPSMKVGTGMTSEVYLARVKDAARLAPGKDDVVVLKVMPKTQVMDMGHRVQELVVSERSNMAYVQGSKFILHLFGHFQDDHVLCLVTEFAAVDFFNQMTNHFGTGAYWSSVKIYAAQTLLGLEAMHKKRLLYRDLKPENMLVRTDGTLLIADFGMSIILKDGEKAHSICGTAEYMSPEMVEHSGYSFMSEVWSFGIFVYEMLTGVTPFECDSPVYDSKVVLRNIRAFRSVEFPKGTHVNSDARTLITALMQRDPEERLGSRDPVGDYASIKASSWFNDIDWEKVNNGEQNGHIPVPYKMPRESMPSHQQMPWIKGPKLTCKTSIASFNDF